MKESMTRISGNLVQNTLRLKGSHPDIGPLRPARSSDADVIQRLGKSIAEGNASPGDIQLTSGYGIHRSYDFPVRAPALMIPALKVLEEMQRIGLTPPRYLVYQATDFIAETNGLDPEKAKESAQKLEAYLRGYVEKFHASIAEHVSFAFGCDYPETVRQGIQGVTESIRAKALQVLEIEAAAKRIGSYEQRNSNATGEFDTYAAANAVYSGATADYPFADQTPSNVQTIIPIGGTPEKPFFTITSDFADAHNPPRKVIPFLTPIGSRPTYYPAKNSGDPMSAEEFDEAMKIPHKDGPIRIDINAMIADGATSEGLRAIYPY
jgi:hypothetical protein